MNSPKTDIQINSILVDLIEMIFNILNPIVMWIFIFRILFLLFTLKYTF